MKGARSPALAAPYQSTTSLWSTVARTAAVVVASAAEISTCAGGLEQAAARRRRNRWWLTLNRLGAVARAGEQAGWQLRNVGI